MWMLELLLDDGPWGQRRSRVLYADSLRELLPVIRRARTAREVLRWQLHRRWDWDDTGRPTSCAGCGEVLGDHQTLHAGDIGISREYWSCYTCPGHWVWRCDCGQVAAWPPAGGDCAAVPRRVWVPGETSG